MRFGIFQSAQWPEGTDQQVRLRDAVDQSVLAEELGFDSVFMTEHHFSRHGIVPDNLSMLAFIAARTQRIRLGTAVSVLPLHDPVRLAESVALVDMLSGGRLDFGIGRGYQWGEFDGFGVSLDERVARFDESIDVILRTWNSSEAFSHTGQYWEYRNVRPQPQPLQKPHPPIWMATVSDDGFDLCVEHGWGVMLQQAVPLDRVAHGARQQIVVELPFDEVILGPDLDGFQGQRLIIRAGQHDERHVGGFDAESRDGVQAPAVRQRQVDEGHIAAIRERTVNAGSEALDMRQPKPTLSRRPEHLLDEPGVTRVVLDQEHVQGFVADWVCALWAVDGHRPAGHDRVSFADPP